MESSRGLVASIAALGLVVAAAITLLVITGAPLDFRDWPSSPKPRPAPGGQGEVLGERAEGGKARKAPALVSLPSLGSTVPGADTRRSRRSPARRVRRAPGSKIRQRRRARHRFGSGRRRGPQGTRPSPPAPVTPPSSPVSTPVAAPEPPWSRHWEEEHRINRPEPGEGEGEEQPKPRPEGSKPGGPKPWPKPKPRPRQPPAPAPPPPPQPDVDDDDWREGDDDHEDDDGDRGHDGDHHERSHGGRHPPAPEWGSRGRSGSKSRGPKAKRSRR